MVHLFRRKRRSLPLDARSAGRSPRSIAHVFLHGISALVLMGVILLTGLPAWAHDFHIETGKGWIKGQAQQAGLGDVLNDLAQRSGYKVFVDEKLMSAPVTFNIPVALDAEKAIQRIVHPYSFALVFTRMPENGDIRIDQVRVFSKGSQSSQYVLLTGDGNTPVISSSYVRGFGNAASRGNNVLAGKAAIDHQVKPMLEVTKSSMGFSGYHFHDGRRGPDYAPDSMTLAKSYTDYRKERKALENRSGNAVLIDAHRKAEQEKMNFRSRRTTSIQQTLEASRGQVKEEK